MITIDCYFGTFHEGLESSIPDPFDIDCMTLPRIFEEASCPPEGTPDLRFRLHPRARRQHAVMPSAVVAKPYYLHRALELLLPEAPPQGPVTQIGVIFAERLALDPHGRTLGMMFDADFAPRLQLPSRFSRIPRQGCAVFLDAIRELRPDDGDFARETLFTTVHELGHVFNLWHIPRPPNFMAPSPRRAPFSAADNAYRFLDVHRCLLQRCSSSPAVQPGGLPFGDRGEFGHTAPISPAAVTRNPGAVDFSIDVAQREFWPWEPIELDIDLRVAHGRAAVPDMIDCGCKGFEIRIEEPDGSHRRYRPPRRYSGNPGRITLTPRRPFHRDISLFGEAGAYTFRQAGQHRIQALCRTSARRQLVSNTLTLNVKPTPAHGSRDGRLASLLKRPDVARLCYHRHGALTPASQHTVDDWLNHPPHPHAAANLHYALGRAALHTVEQATGSPSAPSDTARRHLEAALAFEDLSPQRRRHAATLCERRA